MTDSTTAERYYRESHQAICDLINEDNEHQAVPATPGWTLHDVLAHLTGAMQDFVSGNTEGAPGPEWTASHVQRFRDAHIEAIKSAWRESLDKAGAVFRNQGAQLLPDVVTHEFDVRGALGNTDARDSDRLKVAVDVLISWGDAYYTRAGLPALEIRINGNSQVVGGDTAETSVAMDLFEVSRVLTGRRSDSQVRALDWSAEPEPWLNILSLLGKRDTDLVE